MQGGRWVNSFVSFHAGVVNRLVEGGSYLVETVLKLGESVCHICSSFRD